MRSTGRTSTRPTSSQRYSGVRGSSDARSASRRLDAGRGRASRPSYTPRDRISTRRTNTGRPAPISAGNRVRSGTVVGTTPNLVARTSAPRLGGPRARAPFLGSARSGAFVGRAGSFVGRARGFNNVGYCNTIWSGYWGRPRVGFVGWGGGWGGWNSWNGGIGIGSGWNNCWSVGWGLGSWGVNPWCWNYGLVSPYWAFRTRFWNSCYADCYWNTWSAPYAVNAGYWWYPNSTYCPTYLVTPGSVTVVETTEDEELVELDDEGTAAAAGGREELAAAGGGVGGSAVATERTVASGLAQKYVELGDMYFLARRYDDAVDAYSKARDNAPGDASIHFVMADAVFANGDYHYAAFLIGEAVRLDPTIVTADVDKHGFYADPADFDRQVAALQRYCAEKPYDAWAQLVLGYNLKFSGQPKLAAAAFERTLELDRDNPTATAFLAELAREPAASGAAR